MGCPLQLKAPWYDLLLKWWTEEETEEAALAVQGRYYETGAKFARRRQVPDETTGT